MALVTRGSQVRLDGTSHLRSAQIPGGITTAGEAIDAGAPCYIATADGLVYMSDGTAATEAAIAWGFAPKAYAVGDPITLVQSGSIFEYDEAGGMTGGDAFYVAATAGRLDDTATTGGTVVVARALNSKLIQVV